MTFEMPRVRRTPSREGLIVGVLIGIDGVAGLYTVDLAVRKNPAGTIGTAFYLQRVFASQLRVPALHGHLPRHSIAGLAIITAAATIQTAASARAAAPS